MAQSRTGYVYDEMMTKHAHNTNPHHPESPQRIIKSYEFLQDSGLLQQCSRVNSRCATKDELLTVHTSKHIADVKAMTSDGKDDVCKIYEQWRTYTCDNTYLSSVHSAGACLSMVDAVCTNQIYNGIAIVRPPGHHAEVEESCGFCFFNNVALCAKHAQRQYGLKKILIVDWDIHHGNGVQNIFYDDPSVLYISLHRFDNGDYFPSQKDGDYHFTGKDNGIGYNVNIPWNRDIMGNVEYKAAFDRVVIPIANQFKPDLVLVSCGFDAAAADMIGEYILTSEMYAFMTQQLKKVAKNDKILLMLEGGYNPKSIGECFKACLEVLLCDKKVNLVTTGVPCKRAEQSLRLVVQEQSKFWKLDAAASNK